MKDIYQYLGVLSYIIGAAILCVCMMLCGYLLGGRSSSRFKNVPFESGVIATGNARIRFSIKFYIIAMIFVIFDLEGVYLYIWSVSIQDIKWTGFFGMCVFILTLLVSLIYLIRIGLFYWSLKKL